MTTATGICFSGKGSAGHKPSELGWGTGGLPVCCVSLFPWEARLKFQHEMSSAFRVSRTALTNSQETSN